ncbi:hypothetical protein AAH678_04400 [Sodalis endosymbiont of Spalangia cameroni]|uniref:hypothetical protein n=1 Tax=Sodalis praecaptivus TaxID=1239307 RepID=UPI0031F8F427
MNMTSGAGAQGQNDAGQRGDTPYGTASRYLIRTPYTGVLASQTRHDYCPQSSMIRGVMSPGLVGR